MSRNAKLFVATKNTNIIRLMPKVIEALNVYIRTLLDIEVAKQGFVNRIQFLNQGTNKDLWTNGCKLVSHDFNNFNIFFGIGEQRRMFVTNECNGDYADTYKGEKIIFDLNYWGKSDEIMKVIIPILKEFGRVFYDFNDCDDQGFVEM